MSQPAETTPRPDGSAASVEPVRAVFRRALRDMLLLVGVLAVVGVGVGALVAGTPGVWGALIGVFIALVFSGTTVASMLFTVDKGPTQTGAVVLGAWLLKMVVVIVVLALLGGQDFYHRGVLVGVALVGVLGSVALDYRAVQRGRIPYVTPQP